MTDRPFDKKNDRPPRAPRPPRDSGDSRNSRDSRDARPPREGGRDAGRDARAARPPREGGRDAGRDTRAARPPREGGRDAGREGGRDGGRGVERGADRSFDKKDRRPPLREVICDIDRDILKLLLRRRNIITRMHNAKGFLEPAEEKILRESWEAAVSRVSRDPLLSARFFALMQEVEFLPRPAGPREIEGDAAEMQAEQAAEERRSAFNLAPPPRPVRLHLAAPVACREARTWIFLAAVSGLPLRLGPCLMNDPLVDCVKMLTQLGAAVTREGDGVTAHPGPPATMPDKVFYVGESAWNFYLLLGLYLGRPSRAKFAGEGELKHTDFAAVRRFVPLMGARLVQVIPGSEGLPLRLECSGVFPETVLVPEDLPADAAAGILLAAPFYEQPLTLDLSALPQRKAVLNFVLPLLRAAGAELNVEGDLVRVTPGPLRLPEQPELPMEPELAAFLAALAGVLSGEVVLDGRRSPAPEAEAGLDLLRAAGLDVRVGKAGAELRAFAQKPLAVAPRELPAHFPARMYPLAAALTAAAAVRGAEAVLPPLPASEDGTGMDMHEIDSFLHAVGLERDAEGRLHKPPFYTLPAWNAPSPLWALALALVAGAKPHLKLGNPGILTGLYPAFWALYNALPEPAARQRPAQSEAPAPARRRVRTATAAVIPDLKEEQD